MNNPHLFLKNPVGVKNYVNKVRGFNNDDDEEDMIRDYSYQKERLRQEWGVFNRERKERIRQRTLELPYHLEYIQITFFRNFSDTGNSYISKFGLAPVCYTDFNQTVLFYIQDQVKFKNEFASLLRQFYESLQDINPEGTPYHLMTLISSFSFLSSEAILTGYFGQTSNYLLSFSESVYTGREERALKEILSQYIRQNGGKERKVIDCVWQVEHLDSEIIRTLANNFDIIQRVQSIPPVRISPGPFLIPRFSWDINTIVRNGIPTVGIIDTGIDTIAPFDEISLPPISILPDGCHSVKCDHGTNVASLAVFGREVGTGIKDKQAAAKLLSIQVLADSEGYFSFSNLKEAVIKAHQTLGVRIFNLSVVGKGKKYNAGISSYAAMLDELAHDYDILIFIATGNLDDKDVKNMVEYRQTGVATPEEADFLTYPNHFYGPDRTIDACHECECTNLCEPGESMNNLTVGAIAENFGMEGPHLTDRKEYPAYYTRKYYIDYARPVIEGTRFTRSQRNTNIFKPDIVMPGGDWLAEDAGMLVLGRGEMFTDYYKQTAGTSLAAPLAANLAAKILFYYPDISMQSVKALIINSAEETGTSAIVAGIIERCKEKMAQTLYHQNFSDLERKEKIKISECYNEERLYSNLIGHGLPNEEKCLFSSDKRVVFLIEETIAKDCYKVINLKLPQYLLKSRKKSVLALSGTLCFKFLPDTTNQLGYNPVSVSFKFVNASRNSQDMAALIANEPEDHNRPYSADELKDVLKIKSGLSWTEDFYPANNRIFSNTQKKNFTLRVSDLEHVHNQISIAFRCVARDSVPSDELHPFSFVLSVEEVEGSGLEESLFESIKAINEVENINEIIAEMDIEANH